jgi:urease accessory protein
VAGGRTVLLDQYVPYPFHVTRPFRLNPARPDLATLYLQSASGGVYAADDLALALSVGAGAAAHVTTQSATIVHECRAAPARLATRATVGPGGFLALLPDPLVLFPGADVATAADITLHDGARAVLCDAACLHDPRGEDRRFRRFHGTVRVRDAAGRLRLSDRGGVDGTALGGAGVLGGWRAWGLLLVLAPPDLLPDPAAVEAAAEAAGCLAGASLAPGGAGLAVRLLGPEGGTLGRCVAALAAGAAVALAGCRLAARGK